MPARSKAQARLPLARSIRASMTHQQMHDFAATPRTGLPAHVPRTPAARPSRVAVPHPHRNLGGYLHPKKGGGY